MALNVEAFYDAINGIARSQVQASPSDLTIDAKIAFISDITVGKYKVEYQGNTFTAFATDPTVTYNVGDRVYVLVPEGNYDRKKIILGRSAYNDNLTNADIQDMTNFYVDQGPNWVDPNQGTYHLNFGRVDDDWTYDDEKKNLNRLQLCVVPDEDKRKLVHPIANYTDEGFRRVKPTDEYATEHPRTRFPETYMSDDDITVVDTSFANYAKRYSWLKISADFLTQFNSVHNSGEYSLKAVFIADNPKYAEPGTEKYSKNGEQPRYILIEYVLGFKQFNGSVYSQVVPTPQKAYFAINPGELKGLYSLSLEQDGKFVCDYEQHYNENTGDLEWLPGNEIYDTNNVFVSNVDIRFCKKINLMDELYYVWIEQPLGDSVYAPDDLGNNGRDSVTLVPHMAYGRQEVTKDCRIMWFREDLSIPNEHEPNKDDRDEDGKTYFDYAGPGWRPIEHFIDDNHEGFQLSEDGTLRVYKSEVPWQWRFKLVCVYENDDQHTSGFDIAYVKNRDSKYDLEVQSFTDSSSNGRFLRVTDNNRRVAEQVNPTTGRPYPEWFGDWYYQLPDNSYNTIVPQYLCGPLKINDFSAYEHITFRVTAYDPEQVAPEYGDWVEGQPRNQVEPIGILFYEVNTSTDLDLLIEWEGQSTFNYTALGKAYPSVSEKEYLLAPKINWVHGESLAYDVQIYAPDGAPLGTREFFNEDSGSVDEASGSKIYSSKGYNPPGSMMKEMYQDINNVLHFKVRDEFDAQRTLNTVVVEVHTIQDDKQYEKPLEVTFTKDGDQGTQGTGWTAPIKLTNHTALRQRVWDRKQKKYEYKEVAAPYTTPLSLPTLPIILKKEGDSYRETGQTKVVLRPFVTKDGKKLESIVESGTDSSHYKIKAYWDVRFPQNAYNKEVANASFLRICHPISGAAISNYGGGSRPNTNPENEPGLYAMTEWDGSNKLAGDNPLYNAVWIRYEPKAGKTLSHEDVLNQFIVHCQVDIETDLPSTVKRKMGATMEEFETGAGTGWHRVKSISAWWPIDIFIQEDDTEFDPNIVTLNWPQSIAYDSRGYNPVIDDNYLEFYYGYFPDSSDKTQAKFVTPEVPAKNQTVQTIEENPIPILGQVEVNGELEESEMEEQINAELLYKTPVSRLPEHLYKLKPKSHLNWQEGTVGAISGRLDGGTLPDGTVMPRGTFIRNQIYYLNAYENVDINSWDGQGIDINEDNGTIFAPTIGAGFKGPLTNKFTGVLMGVNTGFMRQTNGIVQYTDIAERELEEYPFMTGLFGYQCGYTSFGLLENGTAFFGRKDRGGRIIIDGYNATIYGGANGELTSPAIGDPMWNSMRLTMVDLTHATGNYDTRKDKDEDGIIQQRGDDESTIGNDAATNGNMSGEQKPTTTSVQGVSQGFNGGFFGDKRGSGAEYGVPSQLPSWYEYIWREAYIKGEGQLPWWMSKEEHIKWSDTVKEHADPFTGQSYTSLLTNPKNLYIDYWEPNIELVRRGWESADIDEEGAAKNLTGFGPSRASTTPAIEIGQHPTGLMPGLLGWGSAEDVFRELTIPGDRNFMVTYDGTLWAMNGVFMGNVIGSNIIGGRLQGVEMGIGDPKEIIWENVQVIDSQCDWKLLKAPITKTVDKEIQESANGQFSVDPYGNVIAKSISIYGGSIDLGTFHIVGTNGAAFGEGGTNDKWSSESVGNLIQFGESDFVGPVHCFGNLGIGPNINGISQGMPPGFDPSNQGNLFQTHGVAALGIILPNEQTEFHEKFAGEDDWMVIENLPYHANGSEKAGSPGIGEESDSIERMAVFGVDSRHREKLETGAGAAGSDIAGYQGHMWPMAHKYVAVELAGTGGEGSDSPTEQEGVHAYMTTMDIFKSKSFKISTGTSTAQGESGNETMPEGGNYFRVGPWGQEGMRYYICQEWQDEQKSEEPTVKRGTKTVRGFMGLVNRNGYGDGGTMGQISLAIGMTSWGSAPIILTSDENFAVRTRNGSFLQSSSMSSADKGIKLDETQVQENGHRSFIYYGGGSKPTTAHISLSQIADGEAKQDNNGYISLELVKSKDGGGAQSYGTGWGKDIAYCGILLDNKGAVAKDDSEKGHGVFIWGETDNNIHLIQVDSTKKDNDAKTTELWLEKNVMRGNSEQGIWFTLEEQAHKKLNEGSNDKGSFGMDPGSAGMYHPKRVAFTSGVESGCWSKTLADAGGGMGILFEGTKLTNWGYDGGYVHIEKSKIQMMGDLAVPDNQYCIYARFG